MRELIIAFVGGGLAGFIAAWLGLRQLHSSNVVAERQKWREKLRELATALGSGICPDDLWIDLQTRLNPFDSAEIKLFELAKSNKGRQLSDDDAKWATETIALLLKHDWERAKIESSAWPFDASRRAGRRLANDRFRSQKPQP